MLMNQTILYFMPEMSMFYSKMQKMSTVLQWSCISFQCPGNRYFHLTCLNLTEVPEEDPWLVKHPNKLANKVPNPEKVN